MRSFLDFNLKLKYNSFIQLIKSIATQLQTFRKDKRMENELSPEEIEMLDGFADWVEEMYGDLYPEPEDLEPSEENSENS